MNDVSMFPEQNTSPHSQSHLSEASRKKDRLFKKKKKMFPLFGMSFQYALVFKDRFPSV